MADWVEWHRAYDDPSSSLARRLEVVKRRLRDALDATETYRPRVLSLCAGDGRDVVSVLAARPRAQPVSAVLVERDHRLARRAAHAARTARLAAIDVRCGEAADPRIFEDVLPVDILMLCGIFGNIEQTEVERLVSLLPSLVVRVGFVIWTRGGSQPDLRPRVRGWFRSVGFDEVAFDGAPDPFGVGLHRLRHPSVGSRCPLVKPLFTFVR